MLAQLYHSTKAGGGRRALAALFVGAAIISCAEPDPGPTTGPHAARRSLAAGPYTVREPESLFDDLAKRAPSSAGFYFDAHGALIVVVRDSVDYGPAQAAIADYLATDRIKAMTPVVIKVKHGDYTFRQLAAWRDVAFNIVFSQRPDASSLDLDEVNNRVTLGFVPSALSAAHGSVVAQLKSLGVDTMALRFVAQDIARPASRAASRLPYASATARKTTYPSDLTSPFDPVVGGVEIRNPDLNTDATLGFVAQSGPSLGFVTVSHQTDLMWGRDQSLEQQPPFGSVIGSENFDPGWYQCGINACRGSDASFHTNLGANLAKGLIARTQSYSYNQTGSIVIDQSRPYFIISAAADAYTGQQVYKIGWRTGWTVGTIANTCIDFRSSSRTGNASDVATCSVQGDYYVEPGDSGSPVFLWNGYSYDVTLVGMIIGQYGVYYYSPLSRINNDLGTLDAVRTATLSAPVVTPSLAGSNPSLTWTSVPGATIYWVFRTLQDSHCRDTGISVYSTTGTSFVDTQTSAIAVGQGQCPYVRYYVTAQNVTERSSQSTTQFFQLPGGIQ